MSATGQRVLHYMSTNVGMTGVETFMLELSSAQRRLGLHPMLHCEVAGRPELAEEAALRGIPLFDFPAPPPVPRRTPRKLGTAVRRAHAVGKLASLLRAHRADLLHVHSVGVTGLHGFLAAACLRVPVVVTHHTALSNEPPVGGLRQLTFALEKRTASRMVLPYATAAEELRAAGMPKERLRVIPFCVDDARFTQLSSDARTAKRHGGDTFRLVMLSRVVEGKGHGELLEAVAAARGRVPGLRLTIVGDGPELHAVQARRARLGLEAVVELAGRVPHTAVPDVLRRADAVVLPSYMSGETFPLSLLEGMALGLPAIATRWFGIPDIVTDGETGLLVPPRDAPALARAIERLATDAAFYEAASRNAAQRVRARFTASAVAREYAALYRETRRR